MTSYDTVLLPPQVIDDPTRRFFFFIQNSQSGQALTAPATVALGTTPPVTLAQLGVPANPTQLWSLLPDGRLSNLATGAFLTTDSANSAVAALTSNTTWGLTPDGRIGLAGAPQPLVLDVRGPSNGAPVDVRAPVAPSDPSWPLQQWRALRTERQTPQPMSFQADLDGTDQWIQCPGIPIGDHDFTVETWVRSTAGGPLVSSTGLEVQGFVVSVESRGVLLFGITQSMPGQVQQQLGVSGPTGLLDGDWHHVACVRRGSSMTGYVDGAPVALQQQGGRPSQPLTMDPSTMTAIGWAMEPPAVTGPDDSPTAAFLSRYRFQGSLDDVRVWTRAVPHDEVEAGMHQRLTGAEAGLAGYWSFDHGDARDGSPNHRDGTLQGTPAFGESVVEIAQAGEPYLIAQAKLMQDYRPAANSLRSDPSAPAAAAAQLEETTGFRVVISSRDASEVPLPCFLTLWSDAPVEVIFADGVQGSLAPDGPGYTRQTTMQGELSFLVEANGRPVTPVIKVRADFMLPAERLVISPDRHAHATLAAMTGNQLLGQDPSGKPLPEVVKGRKSAPLPAGTTAAAADALAKAIAHAMSTTIEHSVEPSRPLTRLRSLPEDVPYSHARMPRYQNVREETRAYDHHTDTIVTHYLGDDVAVSRILIAEHMPAAQWVWSPGDRTFTADARQVDALLAGLQVRHLDTMTRFFDGKRQVRATAADLLQASEHTLTTRWFGESLFDAIADAVHVVVTTVVTTVEHAVSAVASTVRNVVVTVVNAANEVVDAVLQTVEDAIGFVTAAIKRVGADVAAVVDFMRALFDWDDVLLAHGVIERYLTQSRTVVTTAIRQSGAVATSAIAAFKTDVDRQFDQWKQQLTGLSPQNADASLAARPRQDIQSGYVTSMVSHHATSTAPDAAPDIAAALEAAAATFVRTLGQQLDALESSSPGALQRAGLTDRFSDPSTLINEGLTVLLGLIQEVADTALELAEAVVAAVMAAFEAMAEAVYGFCSQPIAIPFVTDFYERVVMRGNGSKLTMFSLVALAGALPATIGWKAVTGADAPLFSRQQHDAFLAIDGSQYNWMSLPGSPHQAPRSPILDPDTVKRLGIGMGFTNAAAQAVWGIAVTWGDFVSLSERATGQMWKNPKFEKPAVFFLVAGQLVAFVANFPWGTDFSVVADRLAFAMWVSLVVPFISNLVAVGVHAWAYPGDAVLSGVYGVVYAALMIALWVLRATQTDTPDRGSMEGAANLLTSLTLMVQLARLSLDPIVSVLAVVADGVMYAANAIYALARAGIDAHAYGTALPVAPPSTA